MSCVHQGMNAANNIEALWSEVSTEDYAGNLYIRTTRIAYDDLGVAESRLTKMAARVLARGFTFAWRINDTREVHGVWTARVEVLAPRTVKVGGWRVAALIEPDQIVILESPICETTADIGRCDHCNTRRARKQAFVLVADAGSRMVVGSGCLKEFNGWDPTRVMSDLSLFREINECIDELGAYDGGGRRGYRTTEWFRFLACACESIKANGFISKKMANASSLPEGMRTTADVVTSMLEMDGTACAYVPAEESVMKAHAVTAWLDEQVSDGNSYMETLKANRGLGCVGPRVVGHVASLPHAYDVAMGKKLAASIGAGNVSTHVGMVGKREVFTLTLTGKREFESSFGIKTLLSFKDATGNKVVWWCSGDAPESAEIGAVLYVTGTVKEHGEYHAEKQTTLTRCTLSSSPPAAKGRAKKVA